jgi:hypothetical protein
VLYVGHFTFLGPDPEVLTDPTPRGWFALAAEAGSPEAAEDKFRQLIGNAKALTALFEDVATVWLDDLVEIKGLPEEGVVTHFHLSPDGDECRRSP